MKTNGTAPYTDPNFPTSSGGGHGFSEASNAGASGSATLDLIHFGRILRREGRLILAALGITLGVALIYSISRTPVYEAYSVTLVKTNPTRMPTGTIEDLLALQHTNRTIENEVGILRQSVPLAERILSQISLEPLIRAADLEGSPTVTRLAEYLLEERVRFEVIGEDMDLIKITATSSDPEEAARIAQLYAEEYQQRSRNNRASAAQSRSFLQEQVEKHQRELLQQEGDLVAFMEREGVVAPGIESEHAVTQAAALEAAIEATRVELEVENASLRELEQEVTRIQPGLLQRVSSSAEQEIARLQEKIAEMEVQANDYYALDPSLRGKEDRNPELAVLTVRIREAQRQLEDRSARFVQEVLAVGGIEATAGSNGLAYVSQLQRDAVQKSIRVRGLEARMEALSSELGRYKQKLQALPSQAIRLAQLERGKKASEQMYLLLSEKLQESSIAGESQIGYVELIRPALIPDDPVVPDIKLNILFGLLAGLLMGGGLAFARQALSGRLQTPDDVRTLGFPLLGVVQEHVPHRKQSLSRYTSARSKLGPDGPHWEDGSRDRPLALLMSALESFRHLRTNIRFSHGQTHFRTLLVTSALQGEGKTSIALNLAGAMAQAGLKTLLLDADLHRPTSHIRLGLVRERGLSDLLTREGPIDWEIYRYSLGSNELFAEEYSSNFYTVPAGSAVTNAAELLGSERMKDLMGQARAAFDIIIIDTPPLLAVTDPILISTLCDGILVVAAAGTTSREALLLVRERLASIGPAAAPLLGVVLNGVNPRLAGPLEYGYAYTAEYADTQ